MTFHYGFKDNRAAQFERHCIGLLLAVLFLGNALPVEATEFKIEIDYMVGTDHTHEPSAAVIATVVDMFACQGHVLTIDKSDAIPHHEFLRRDPDDCAGSLFSYDGSADSFGAIYDAYADHNWIEGWHYCIFAHAQEDEECEPSSSSGLGQRPGFFFIVTLGTWPDQTGSEFEQAATLAHEFGHNLGLTHCGVEEGCSGIGNYLPILPSTMSYRYQLVGVRTNLLAFGLTIDDALFKEIDYSHGRMCRLNENNLNEPFGTAMTAVDWNCDGSFDTGVAQDINGGRNGWCGSTSTRSWVRDANEWWRISNLSKSARAVDVKEEVSCITWQEAQEVQRELAMKGVAPPTLITEPCLEGENVYVGPWNDLSTFSCDWPAPSVHEAHDNAPSNSRFFMLPGTFNETPSHGTIVLDKPGKWFCNVGTAVIE